MSDIPFTITTWGPNHPRLMFPAYNAYHAYDLVLMKAIYPSLQVTVTDAVGKEISLEDLTHMANRLSE